MFLWKTSLHESNLLISRLWVKYITLHNVSGCHPISWKDWLLWKRRKCCKQTASDLNCDSSLGLQPASALQILDMLTSPHPVRQFLKINFSFSLPIYKCTDLIGSVSLKPSLKTRHYTKQKIFDKLLVFSLKTFNFLSFLIFYF